MENECETYEETAVNKDKSKKVWLIIEAIILTIILKYFDASFSTILIVWLVNVLCLVEDKINSFGTKKLLKAISFVLVLVFFVNVYNLYLDNKYMRMVKKEKYYSVSYEELFDNFSDDVKWKCINNDRFTQLNFNKSERYNGSFIAEVSVSGGAYFYEKETDYVLKFNISEIDEDIIPISLEIGEEDYSEYVNEFLQAVYDQYNENFNFN